MQRSPKCQQLRALLLRRLLSEGAEGTESMYSCDWCVQRRRAWVRRMVENQAAPLQSTGSRCALHSARSFRSYMHYREVARNTFSAVPTARAPTGGQPNCTRNTSFVWRGLIQRLTLRLPRPLQISARQFILLFRSEPRYRGSQRFVGVRDTFGLRKMYLNWPPIPPPPRFSELEKALMIAGSALFASCVTCISRCTRKRRPCPHSGSTQVAERE